MDRIKFDVGGQMFSVSRNILRSGPDSRLKELSNLESDVVVIDRPADMFAAILAMYQTGALHIPKTCCPGTFLLELEYWDIKMERLTSCCYFKVKKFVNQQKNLKRFQTNMHAILVGTHRVPSKAFPRLDKFRERVWNLIDYKERTILSSIYFAISLLMVVVSVCNLAFSTDPTFRRNMTNCERYKYMKQFDMEDLDLVGDMLKADCGNDTDTESSNDTTTVPSVQLAGDGDDYDFVELVSETTPPTTKKPPPPEPCETEKILFHPNGTTYFFSNVTGNATRCMDRRSNDFPFFFIPTITVRRIKVPNFKIPLDVFRMLELVTTIYFTIDIVLRLLSCPSCVKYFMSVVNAADFVALLGVYLYWLLESVRPKEQYEVNWFDILGYLQMLRSLRLFRLVMSFNISKVLMYSVEQSLKDGFIMVLILIAGMCTFSTCLYLSEDKDVVKTIPDAWYWSVITMTTVGYGDITPKSAIGRIVACLCAISGVLMFSLTVPLFVNQFMTLYQYADVKIEQLDDNDNNDNSNIKVCVDRHSPSNKTVREKTNIDI